MITIATEYYRYTAAQLESKLGTSVINGLCTVENAINRSKKSKYSVAIKHRNEYGLEVRRSLFTSGFFFFTFSVLSFLHCFFYRSPQYLPCGIICGVCFFALYAVYVYSKRRRFKCQRSTIPNVVVKRNGSIQRICGDELICGDLIYLSEGDVLTCDARLVYTDDFRVLEKNVSGGDGEKNASFICYEPNLDPMYQKNMVFAQSTVSSGHAMAIVCATGQDTLAAEKGLPFAWDPKFATSKEKNIHIFSSLRMLCDTLLLIQAFFTVVLSFIIGVLPFTVSFNEAFMLLLCTCTCTLFECIYPLICISVIHHTTETDKNGQPYAYVKDLSSLEALKDISVLAVPKLSVLCTPSINIIYSCGHEYDASVVQSISECKHLLCIAASTVDPSVVQSADDEALSGILEKIHLNKQIIDGFYIPISYRKSDFFASALIRNGKETLLCCRSTPSHLLKHCKYKNDNGNITLLSEIELAELTLLYKKYEQKNLRVLAYASKRVLNGDDSLDCLCFEGFLAMCEQITKSDIKLVSELESRGIKLIVFSDDMSDSNFELGKILGIVSSRQNVLTSYELNHSNLSIIKLKMSHYRMFLGLNAREKQYVLEHLRCVKGEKIGIAVSDFSDAVLISSKKYTSFGIVASTDCGVVKLLSDSVIIPNSEKSTFACIDSLILRSSQLFNGFSKIRRHFTFSAFITVFAVLFSLFAPFFTISAQALVLCASLLDLTAAGYFIFGNFKASTVKNVKPIQVFVTVLFTILTPLLLYASGTGMEICSGVVVFSLIFCRLASVLICTKPKNRNDFGFVIVYCLICIFLLLLYSFPISYFIYSLISPLVFILSELIVKITDQN